MEDKILSTLGIGLIAAVLVIAIAFLWSFITLWSWNAVMPFLFHFKTINLIQAFAINLLASLFKSTASSSKK